MSRFFIFTVIHAACLAMNINVPTNTSKELPTNVKPHLSKSKECFSQFL